MRSLSTGLARALETERIENGKRIALVRVVGVTLFFSIFLVLGGVLGIRSWQGNLRYFAPYWGLTVVLFLAGRRHAAVARTSSLAIAFIDMPMVFLLNWATFPTTPNVGAVAGYALGIFVFLLIVESLALEDWKLFVTAVMGAVCEGALQYFAGISAGAIVATFVIMALAGATCAYGSRRMFALVGDVTREQEKLNAATNELKIARHIQTSILPPAIVAPGFDIAATMATASEIGGDYYDVRPFGGGLWLGIGDVSGHGLDAGLVMMMIQTGVAALTQNTNATPFDVVCGLNEILFDNVRSRLRRDDHATFSILKVSNDGAFTVAGAHEDMIVVRAKTGRSEVLETHGTWIGGMPSVRHVTPTTSYALEKGDTLLLFTDGVTEARNRAREMFGIDRLIQELEAAKDFSPQEICARIEKTLAAWTDVRDDDVTLVCVRFHADSPAT